MILVEREREYASAARASGAGATRLLVRHLLRDAGLAVDTGDPIEWLTRRSR